MDPNYKNSDIGLLDQLAAATGCTVLSDLHRPQMLPHIQKAAAKCTARSYSLREWNDALAYIVGNAPACHTQEEAQTCLVNWDKPRL